MKPHRSPRFVAVVACVIARSPSARSRARNRYKDRGPGRQAARGARQAAARPERSIQGPGHDGTAASRRSSPTSAPPCASTKAQLTPLEETEYGGWKKLGLSLGHFADIVTKNERDGFFTVGLLATCPSMPGLVAGLAALGIDDRAAPHRHAVARRASRLQHAGDDAQRVARRHAGGGGDGPRAARDAPGREARSADVRSATS